MKFYTLLLPLLLSACSEKVQIGRLDHSKIEKSKLTTQIQKLIDSAKVTGVAIAIFNEGEVVYEKAFGYANLESGEPLTTDMVFYGASFSKAVFAYLVSQLAAEGIIDLDRPLRNICRSRCLT